MEMNTVITISREYGSGGRDIGKLVAEKLNIPYYDQEITEIAANPTTADVAINTWAIFRNTSTGAVELWANNNGTMVKVALA